MSSTGHMGQPQWRVAWRAGLLTSIALSLVTLAAGWAVTLFDEQYRASTPVERMVAGLLAGAFGTALLAPVTATIGAIAGIAAGMVVGRRRIRTGPSTGA